MPHVMPIIAVVSDAWIIGFGIFNTLFAAAVSVAIWRLTTAQRRYEGVETRLLNLTAQMLDERHKMTVQGMDERHQLTTKLVDERFRAMSHEVGNSVNNLVLRLKEVADRLKDTELVTDGLGDRDQKIELTVAGRFDELKDFLRENLAGKKDLQRHEESMDRRHQANEERMRELELRVAVLADRLGTNGTK